MYAGGAGAILPNKVTSKHNFRYVPRMSGPDLVKKLRAQLDANGFKDVEVKLIGDIPWSRGSKPDSDISNAHKQTLALWGMNPGDTFATFFGVPSKSSSAAPARPASPGPAQKAAAAPVQKAGLEADTPTPAERPAGGGYWPSYLFTDGEVGQKIGHAAMPMGSMAGFMAGGRAHAANEYLVIEGKGRTPGMATAEKYVAATVLNYANLTTTPPKAKHPAAAGQ
jgi:acetylornithine deacetylase/succinyl-diaminopimelate desuccinylase-like protein